MCGIVGMMATGVLPSDCREIVDRARDAISHRGPDDADTWVDPNGVAFGHRRLSIIDTSHAGHQPMTSHSGRYVVTYNGEIYNFRALRAELEADGVHEWIGHSDTEVILAGVERWGLDETLLRMQGMFALALWDRRERVLTLARDAIGEKPLYYGWQGSGGQRILIFASELAAIQQFPMLDRTLDRRAVNGMMMLGYVPEPLTIYRSISKLEPGTRAVFGAGLPEAGRLRHFWRVRDEIDNARTLPTLEGEAAVDALEETLGSAVEKQMVADVPLGAFLSGGLDSSAIVALMKARGSSAVKTFTIGYADQAYDESQAARSVANALKTDHHEWIVSARDALEVIPQLSRIYSEPFADSSQIPTYLVSRFARSEVTVALSGDAGDELFGGYNRHTYTYRSWTRIQRTPRALRAALASTLGMVPAPVLNRFGERILGNRVRMLGDKLQKAASVLSSGTIDEVYSRLIAAGAMEDEALNVMDLSPRGDSMLPSGLEPARRMMALDLMGYLPGDILTKVDRAAMANSLETRVPMLDPAVIRLSFRMPTDTLIRDGRGKWPLRRLLARHIPPALIDRPKMGFGVPLDSWLRGPLKGWGEALVMAAQSELDGLVEPRRIARLWAEHQSGLHNRQHQLWPILMLASWIQDQNQLVPPLERSRLGAARL